MDPETNTETPLSTTSPRSPYALITIANIESLTLAFRPGLRPAADILSVTDPPMPSPSPSPTPKPNDDPFDVPIWIIACYCIILLCAIVGNSLVVITLIQNRRMRTITNVFLLNLAIADLLLAIFCVPVTLIGTILRDFIFTEFLCKFFQLSQATVVAVCAWTLVAIACERYYAICHPLRSRVWQTVKHANRIIACIWLSCIVFILPIADYSQLVPMSRPGQYKCREVWPADAREMEIAYNILIFVIMHIVPLLSLIYSYFWITNTLYSNLERLRNQHFGNSGPDVGIVTPAGYSNNNSCGTSSRRSTGNLNQVVILEMRPGYNDGVPDPNSMDNQLDILVHQEQQQCGSPLDFVHEPHCTDGVQHLLCMSRCATKIKRPRLQQRQQLQQQHYYQHYQQYQQQYKQHQQQQQQELDDLPGTSAEFYIRAQRIRHQQEEMALAMSGEGDRRGGLGSHNIEFCRAYDSKSLESTRRVMNMFLVLVLEFFICWTPLFILNLLTVLIGNVVYEYVDYTTVSIIQLLAYSSSCCNPITYCFMNAGFRRCFVATIKSMRPCPIRGRFCIRRRRRNRNVTREAEGTNLSMAGNSIVLGNSVISSHIVLESPRL